MEHFQCQTKERINMSQKAYDALEQARKEIMESQRVCAWCGSKFKTRNGLVRHILTARHRGELTETEQLLLDKLNEEKAD